MVEADIVDDFDIQPTVRPSKENQVNDVGIQASVDRKMLDFNLSLKEGLLVSLCIYTYRSMRIIYNSLKFNYMVWCINQIKLPSLQLCNKILHTGLQVDNQPKMHDVGM